MSNRRTFLASLTACVAASALQVFGIKLPKIVPDRQFYPPTNWDVWVPYVRLEEYDASKSLPKWQFIRKGFQVERPAIPE